MSRPAAAVVVAVLAAVAVASARTTTLAPVVAPAVAIAATLVAAVFLVAGGAVTLRGAGPRRSAAGAMLLGLALLGWGTLLAVTWPDPPGSLRLARAAVALLVGYLPALLVGFLGYTAVRGRLRPRRSVDFVVVLGSRLQDGAPSPLLAARLEHALAMTRHPAVGRGGPALVVSGGRAAGDRVAEADAMARHLVSRGLPADRVLREDRSRDTAQNLLFSHAVMSRRSPGYRCAVVTSGVHVPRAALLARRAGIRGRVFGAPAGWSHWPVAAVREFLLLLAEYRRSVTWVGLLLVVAIVVPAAIWS